MTVEAPRERAMCIRQNRPVSAISDRAQWDQGE